MNHMMIDLETLATSANALVVSVGACVFTDTAIVRKGYWVLGAGYERATPQGPRIEPGHCKVVDGAERPSAGGVYQKAGLPL